MDREKSPNRWELAEKLSNPEIIDYMMRGGAFDEKGIWKPDNREDSQADILSGNEIDIGIISLMPEFYENPQVREAVKELIRLFPDKEVIDY